MDCYASDGLRAFGRAEGQVLAWYQKPQQRALELEMEMEMEMELCLNRCGVFVALVLFSGPRFASLFLRFTPASPCYACAMLVLVPEPEPEPEPDGMQPPLPPGSRALWAGPCFSAQLEP